MRAHGGCIILTNNAGEVHASIILSIVMWLLANVAYAFEIEDRAVFGDETDGTPLRIVSTADISYFKPIIDAFRAFRPDVTIDYTVASSTEVMDAIRGKNTPLTS